MSLHGDLLEQARHLATRERRRPKQASLRRAISAAYYALFHLLLDAGSKQIATHPDLRLLVRRAFAHGEMKKAAKTLAGGTLPDHIGAVFTGPVPVELRRVARAFVALQEARHDADYNLTVNYSRVDVLAQVTAATDAFKDWAAVRGRPADRAAVELFLTSMLLWDRWGR